MVKDLAAFDANPKASMLVEADPTVGAVLNKYVTRHEEGMIKYGMSMRENPAGALEWLEHLQEELMDATLYIERFKEELKSGS